MSREVFEDEALSRYEYLLNEFKNLAINRFKWEGLPNGLTSEKLEEMLIEYGQLMGFDSGNMGKYILPCYQKTDLNVYGLSNEYNVFGLNGKFNETISIDDGVLLKNNPLGSADLPTLEVYAKRIDDIEMTQDVNLFQQCIPKVLLADENSKLTAKNIINQLRKFKFVVLGKKSLANNIIASDLLDTTSPYLLDKLQDHRNSKYNELLSFLGIENANTDKKERLITSEVESNNDNTKIYLDLMYDLRKNFCDEYNEKFGESIKVEKREVQENGELHDNSRGDNRE